MYDSLTQPMRGVLPSNICGFWWVFFKTPQFGPFNSFAKWHSLVAKIHKETYSWKGFCLKKLLQSCASTINKSTQTKRIRAEHLVTIQSLTASLSAERLMNNIKCSFIKNLKWNKSFKIAVFFRIFSAKFFQCNFLSSIDFAWKMIANHSNY